MIAVVTPEIIESTPRMIEEKNIVGDMLHSNEPTCKSTLMSQMFFFAWCPVRWSILAVCSRLKYGFNSCNLKGTTINA